MNHNSYCLKCNKKQKYNHYWFSHCCDCKKIYRTDTQHCCNCDETYPIGRNHCCKCKMTYSQYHCCKCGLEYCETETHCCECKHVYLSGTKHLCGIVNIMSLKIFLCYACGTITFMTNGIIVRKCNNENCQKNPDFHKRTDKKHYLFYKQTI